MIQTGRLALSVAALEDDGYHFMLLEAVTVPGELLCFRPKDFSEAGYPTPLHAWFAGVGAVRKELGS